MNNTWIRLATVIGVIIAITGCATTKPIVNQTQIIVYEPPTTLYNCPVVRNFPDGEAITNREVANTVEKLYSANRTCSTNMTAIRNSIESAKEVYNK